MTKATLSSSSNKSGRRFHELSEELAEPLGDLSTLTAVETSVVHSAAALMLRLEQMQEALIAGENIPPDRMVRLSSEARRALTVLRRARQAKAKKHYQGADPLTDLKAWADA
jgi:hypothetical protein